MKIMLQIVRAISCCLKFFSIWRNLSSYGDVASSDELIKGRIRLGVFSQFAF